MIELRPTYRRPFLWMPRGVLNDALILDWRLRSSCAPVLIRVNAFGRDAARLFGRDCGSCLLHAIEPIGMKAYAQTLFLFRHRWHIGCGADYGAVYPRIDEAGARNLGI